MGIHLKNLLEGCCEYPHQLLFLDGDDFCQNRATCDKVIECKDKYILLEEKSFIFAFFEQCCKEKKESMGKYIDNGKFTEKLFDFIDSNFTIDEKRRVFAESTMRLFMSSLDKVSNTTHILATQYNEEKSTNMPIIYLYCKSQNSPIDSLANIALSKYKNEKKQIMVECSKLEKFLKNKGCI